MSSARQTNKDIRRNNILQLVLGLVIILLLNIIGSYIFTRFDLTTEKRYSLSPSTKKLLRETDDIFYFKVFLEGEFPAGFKMLSRSTREMLDEFRAFNDNIQYEFINPSEAPDAKTRNEVFERLIQQGLQPTDINVRKKEGMQQQRIFPGAIVSHKGREIPLSLISEQIGAPPDVIINNSIQALEYNISNAIRKLSNTGKPKIAFTQGHGELKGAEIADISRALSDYYIVESVNINGRVNALTERKENEDGTYTVLNKYKAIIIAKPDSVFSEKDKFIIDQYIMKGGKVLWLIDPVFASMDSIQSADRTMGITRDINLNDMLFRYGVRLNSNLLMDLNALPIPLYTGQIGNQPQFSFFPWYYFPVLTSASSHPVVNNLNAVRTEFISSIDTVGNPAISKTVLLQTSKYTRVANTPVMISLDILRREPDPADYNQPPQAVAVLLEGEFESLYNNRIPAEIAQAPEIGFTGRSPENRMIVMADGDLIKNQVQFSAGTFNPYPLGYDRFTGQTFGNRELMLNAVNYLCDDTGLMAVRSRELRLRSLDVTRARKDLLMWQLINTAGPVLLVILFGFIQSMIRKYRYAR
ncbi:gliding-associated putative ABC transporter substrate-binding component GldG [Lentimicrobium saccharophilum]|uniref:Gliding-associated putative ABC transporter substrate-binding component GldG n=1 Tax=Lentimicrobium saccharophilum TaxID=1678841 RepID=A0A0S7C5I8_9BACT|nr:gliding motility-associated ABC transporter substrate-binding protein GldG [Lentimicrobium saccharophilum]GAP45140.1 gliding-associated putative ABC transporter substrate-binding component GldG [Lentimicrobium saccharophilum]